MEFFNSAIEVLQTLVVALGAGLGVWDGATVEAADFKSQTASEITFVISSKVADGEITAVTKAV